MRRLKINSKSSKSKVFRPRIHCANFHQGRELVIISNHTWELWVFEECVSFQTVLSDLVEVLLVEELHFFVSVS